MARGWNIQNSETYPTVKTVGTVRSLSPSRSLCPEFLSYLDNQSLPQYYTGSEILMVEHSLILRIEGRKETCGDGRVF